MRFEDTYGRAELAPSTGTKPMILVTGGAGFIGANFVLDWIAADRRAGRQPRRAHLRRQPARTSRSLDGDARHVFVQGDIGDRRAARRAAGRAPAARRRPLRGREPRRPQHPRPGGVRPDQRRRHLHAARGGARALGGAGRGRARAPSASSTSRPTRSTARSRPTRRRSPRRIRYEPNSPYSASKAASDHLVRAWHHTYGLPVLTTNCSQQLRAVPLPREADPADDRQRAGRQAAAGLRRRPCRCATGSTSTTTARAIREVLARGRVGETYNIGGWNEKPNIEIVHTDLRAARRAAARSGRAATRA